MPINITSFTNPAEARARRNTVLEQMATDRIPEVMLHGERVARYAQAVAREWALEAEAARMLRTAARFHDIGKLAMPADLLTRPSPLSQGEWAVMHRHVEVGTEILMATRTLGPRAIAVTGPKRQELLPAAPTMIDSVPSSAACRVRAKPISIVRAKP